MDPSETTSGAEKVIMVTGFGPFEDIQLNSSSVAVDKLKVLWDANKQLSHCPIKLVVRTQIPVTYKAVQDVVDEIWDMNPVLVVHVGVDDSATKIALEQKAFNARYSIPDESKQLCDCEGYCIPGGCMELHCGLDLQRTCERLSQLGFKAKVSHNPGMYLCGYIYYRSLHRHCDRTVFIHVPPINRSQSELQLALTLYEVILDLAEQRGLQLPRVQLWSSS